MTKKSAIIKIEAFEEFCNTNGADYVCTPQANRADLSVELYTNQYCFFPNVLDSFHRVLELEYKIDSLYIYADNNSKVVLSYELRKIV